MTLLAAGDWQELCECAEAVGVQPERVRMLRRRFDQVDRRPGKPYVLLVGQEKAGLELLLSRWLKPSVGEALAAANEKPLVLSRLPRELDDTVRGWAKHPQSVLRDHVCFALRTSGPLSAASLAQLQPLHVVDLAVIVVRLGQPLTVQERQMAKSIATLAATVKVLIVGLPSEEAVEGEITELSAYAKAQLEQAGFDADQYLETGVWFTDGQARPGRIRDLQKFLTPDPRISSSNLRIPLHRDLKSIVEEGLRRSQSQGQDSATSTVIPVEETERLADELTQFLQETGNDAKRHLAQNGSDKGLSDFVTAALKGWSVGASVEGFWVRYVDNLRPGTYRSLVQCAESAFDECVTVRSDLSGRQSEINQPIAKRDSIRTRAFRTFKPIGFALLVGLVAAGLTVFFPMPDGVRYLVFGIATLAGYAASALIWRHPSRNGRPANTVVQTREVELVGWDAFVATLIDKFRGEFSAAKPSLADRWQRLHDRVLEEINHY